MGYVLLALIVGLLGLLVLAIILEIRDRKLERQQLPSARGLQADEKVDFGDFDEEQDLSDAAEKLEVGELEVVD